MILRSTRLGDGNLVPGLFSLSFWLARLCRLSPQRPVDRRKAIVPGMRDRNHLPIDGVDQLPPSDSYRASKTNKAKAMMAISASISISLNQI
jgi:hypothetical protein